MPCDQRKVSFTMAIQNVPLMQVRCPKHLRIQINDSEHIATFFVVKKYKMLHYVQPVTYSIATTEIL